MTTKVESGVQLVTRLGGRPQLAGLEPALFGDGPSGAQIVELFGEDGTGKTQAVHHLAANALLPAQWSGVELGGRGVGVVVIDTDYTFSLLRLTAILESRLVQRLEGQAGTSGADTGWGGGEVDILVKDCLERLHIIHCESTEQLILSLYELDEELLSQKPDVGLLFIDSISAFYWIDRSSTSDSVSAVKSSQRRLLAALESLMRDHGLLVITTRAALFATRSTHTDSGGSTGTDSASRASAPPGGDRWNYLGPQWQQATACTYTMSVVGHVAGHVGDKGTLFTVEFKSRVHQKTVTTIKRQFHITDWGLEFISS